MVWQKTVKAPVAGINSPINPSPQLQIPADWKTYTNTKYHYSFRYPKEYYIYQLSDDGASRQAINQDAGAVEISERKTKGAIFSVWDTNYKTLDPDRIKIQFGATDLNNIRLTQIVIANQSAYSVESKENGKFVATGFHFVQNLSGQILQIALDMNDLVVQKIFSSLKFTK